MSASFGRYRRTTTRREGHDYARAATYFVTVVTAERGCWFGEVQHGVVALNPLGRAVERAWQESPAVRPGIVLGPFVVMPNHLHALVHVPSATAPGDSSGWQQPAVRRDTLDRPVVTRSLGALIRGFKAEATRRVNTIRNTPGRPLWQANYHEHIVRDEASLTAIKGYIMANPARWSTDRENTDGVADEWERSFWETLSSTSQ